MSRRDPCAVRKLDPDFTPRRLKADGARVVFHPVDFAAAAGVSAATYLPRWAGPFSSFAMAVL